MPPRLVASPGSSYSSLSSEAIKELVLESSELTGDIQQLLDYQALQLLGPTATDNDKNSRHIGQHNVSQHDISNEYDIHRFQRISTEESIGQFDIHKIRKLLRKTMNRLRLTTDELAETLRREVETQQSLLSRIQRDVTRTSKLQEMVRKVNQESDEALKLQKVLKREQDVNVCITYPLPSLIIYNPQYRKWSCETSFTNFFFLKI